MNTELSDLEWLQEKYCERGFLVIACNYPKDIGEVLSLEDKFLDEGTLWRVTAISDVSELVPQIREPGSALQRPYFYRAEAMD